SNIQSLDASLMNLITNAGGGLNVTANDSPIGMITAMGNTIVGNTGGDGILLDLTNSGSSLVAITDSQIEFNTGDGIDLDLDGSAIDELIIANNASGMAAPGGTFA